MTATLIPKGEEPDLYVGEIVEIIDGHPWGGCIVVVDEVRSWGCIASIRLPDSFMPIRLHAAEVIRLGARVRDVIAPPTYRDPKETAG